MGAIDGASDEQPMHDVRISAFWVDRTEVTNEQFTRFVKETGYITTTERPGAAAGWVFVMESTGAKWQQVPGADWRHPSRPSSDIRGREKFPVVQVGWEDAAAFARWAGKRLPTEAEWEYAARGGAMHLPFVWGRELTPGGHWFANIWQGPLLAGAPAADGFAGLAPVGSFRTNDFDLADMAGNVWEWTADWYRADYYAKSPHKDPPGPDAGLDPDEQRNKRRGLPTERPEENRADLRVLRSGLPLRTQPEVSAQAFRPSPICSRRYLIERSSCAF